MAKLAVRAEGLGKKYTIGHLARPERYPAVRDVIATEARRLARKARAMLHGQPIIDGDELEEIWALRDVSFDVAQGEVLGIIGRNGAGKSTLLKILSRITEPTTGRASIHGRVASLLEVGTGFHPDLTGRENIFLNGAILGMTRAEIRRRFDDIVEFAELAQFLDTPLKRYSSGMYMRLAFAVAAHLASDILVIDEVLAVGDAQFQRKCLGKMEQVAREGRTVLFVSHNLAAVASLCTTAVLLQDGASVRQGDVPEVIADYQRRLEPELLRPLAERRDREGSGAARLVALAIRTVGGEPLRTGSALHLSIAYASSGPLRRPKVQVGIYDLTNVGLVLLDSDAAGGLPDELPPTGEIHCTTAPLMVTAGRCYLNVALFRADDMADYVRHAAYLDFETADIYGSGKIPPRDWVMFVVPHRWSLSYDAPAAGADPRG